MAKRSLACKQGSLELPKGPDVPEPEKVVYPWGGIENLKRISRDLEYKQLDCCGIVEASGLNSLRKVEDVLALRRVTGSNRSVDEENAGDDYEYSSDRIHAVDEDQGDTISAGLVLVSTIPSQKTAIRLLPLGGFEKLCSFKNPNSLNTVTLWGATTF